MTSCQLQFIFVANFDQLMGHQNLHQFFGQPNVGKNWQGKSWHKPNTPKVSCNDILSNFPGYGIPKCWRICIYTKEINHTLFMYPHSMTFKSWRWLMSKASIMIPLRIIMRFMMPNVCNIFLWSHFFFLSFGRS